MAPRVRRLNDLNAERRNQNEGNQNVGGDNQGTGGNQRARGNQGPEPNQGGDMFQLMQTLVGVVQQQQNQLNNMAQPRQHNGLAEFKKLGPPSFEGTTEPYDAEKWIQEMEKAFDAQGYSDEEKVTFAAYMLQGSAYEWWQMEKQMIEEDEEITWKMFRDAFYEEYFPANTKRDKIAEFASLVQRNRTVDEYHREFNRLAKYAPQLVATEEERARKFEDGLKPEIQARVIPFELKTFKLVLRKALLVERGMKIVQNKKEDSQKKEEDDQKKRPRPSGLHGEQSSGGQSKRRETQNLGDKSQQDSGAWCRRCKAGHSEADCSWINVFLVAKKAI